MNRPVQIGEVVKEEVVDISSQGKAIIKVDNFTVFTTRGIIGELVEVKIVGLEKNYARGETISIVKESPNRVQAICEVFEKCGGCQLQALEYSSQLEYKKSKVQDALERIANLRAIEIEDTIGMEEPYRYRNNVQIPIGKSKGKAIIGNFERDSNRIVDREVCYIEDECADKIVEVIREYINKYDVSVYNKRRNSGFLRHVIIRTSQATGQAIVILVTNDGLLSHQEELEAMLREAVPNITGLLQNINKKRTSVVMGKTTFPIFGEEYLTDYIGDLEFKISPESFFQINTSQAKVLYDEVIDLADLKGDETVVDLYSGIGTISLYLARRAKMVYGVEIVPEAIEDALYNAELNNIDNVGFIEGAAETILPQLENEGIYPDLLVMDPPRKGADQALLETLVGLEIGKIIYVSCNPSTLARDLDYLTNNGYKVIKVQPVDMFPQTTHVETVVLIEKE